MIHPVVSARCIKGHERVIHPFEIAFGSYPTCGECGRMVMPKETRECDCDWVAPTEHSGQPGGGS